MYIGERMVGVIQKKMTFFRPEFIVDCNGWSVSGDFWGWDYTINDFMGNPQGRVIKEFAWTDTYILDVFNDADALTILMIVIAIDAEKDDRSN
jgi:uncharacterized protein YxjI